MTHPIRFWQRTLTTALITGLFGISLAFPLTANQNITSMAAPPAGQKCPDGRNVIGFDAGGNIICSGDCGNLVLNAGESCDDGNTVSGDGCSAACQTEKVGGVVGVREPAYTAPAPVQSAPAAVAADAVQGPIITDVDPTNVVFGKSGVTVTIEGSGFDGTSVILFNGNRYQPTVDSTGTRLTFKLDTSDLIIGAYPITVLNGSGQEATRKRGLVIY
jgi:cysteine-rich repeat protein